MAASGDKGMDWVLGRGWQLVVTEVWIGCRAEVLGSKWIGVWL